MGDTIQVTFQNKIDRALSIHPHGVFYTKANEGALYNDGTSGALQLSLWWLSFGARPYVVQQGREASQERRMPWMRSMSKPGLNALQVQTSWTTL